MADKRINIFDLMKQEGQLKTLQVYQGREVVADPYEHNKTLTFMNPIPVKGIVKTISVETLHWKYWGQIPVGSIQVIAEKKNLTLLKTADKIKYNNEYFKCWKDDSMGFAIIERTDYIVVALAKKEL